MRRIDHFHSSISHDTVLFTKGASHTKINVHISKKDVFLLTSKELSYMKPGINQKYARKNRL